MLADVKMETDRAGGDRETKLEEEATTSGKQSETNGSQEGTAVKKGVEDMEATETCPRIFTLAFCNSYGSSDTMPQLQDNGKPMKLTSEFVCVCVCACLCVCLCALHLCACWCACNVDGGWMYLGGVLCTTYLLACQVSYHR